MHGTFPAGCNQARRTRPGCRLVRAGIVSALIIMSGCASDDSKELKTRTVGIQAFSTTDASLPATSAPATQADTQLAEDTEHSTVATAVRTVPPAATPGAPTAVAATHPAKAGAARPLNPGDEMVVESVIGQVSGRPIFADELLEPISDQLQRESERLSRTDFVERARTIIHQRLVEVVLDELFLAEAEASLTEQQKMGLLAFLKDLQEKDIAQRGGTIFGAQQKIAKEQEMTLEEYEEAQKNKVLVWNLLNQRIQPRVIVSWRDVQREYELRRNEFNPPAEVTLRRLTLSTAEQHDVIEQVKSRLATGDSFDSIVQDLSLTDSVMPVGGGEGKFTVGPAGLGDLQVAETYKPALAKLKVGAGQTSEAIEVRTDTVWLHIDKVEQPSGKSLFDVQEQLIGELRARREEEERNKYIQTLFEKGIYDELEQMSRRVLAVAVLRYSK